MSTSFDNWGSRNDIPTSEAFKAMNDLSKPVKEHLIKVYSTLATLCLTTAVGAYVHIAKLFLFGGGVLSSLIGLVSMFGVMVLPDTPENRKIRYGLLFNFAFMEGLSIGPIIDYALKLHSSGTLIINASILTTIIFGAFTLSALLSSRRMWIYLGGILFSAVSILFWISLLNSFFGLRALFSVELYLGLLVFCGYVIYDTQLIVYRATHLGSRDVVMHTLGLFIDLVGVFIRILIILMRNSEEKRRRKRGGNRNRSGYAGQ